MNKENGIMKNEGLTKNEFNEGAYPHAPVEEE